MADILKDPTATFQADPNLQNVTAGTTIHAAAMYNELLAQVRLLNACFQGADTADTISLLAAIVSGNVTIGGDLTLNSDHPTVTIGSGTGSTNGQSAIVINKADAINYNPMHFQMGGVGRWTWQFDTSENLALLRRDVNGGVIETALLLAWATGHMTLAQNLFLNSASPLQEFGNNTGSPIQRFRKATAGNTSYADLFANSLREWDLVHQGTTGDLVWNRYVAGVAQGAALRLKNSDGIFSALVAMNVAGADVATDALADADDMGVGQYSGHRGATIFSGPTSRGWVHFSGATGVADGGLAYDQGNSTFYFRVEEGDVFLLDAGRFAPTGASGFILGDPTNSFDVVYAKRQNLGVQTGTSITLGANQWAKVDNSGGAVTITLPGSQVAGATWWIVVRGSATNDVALDPPSGEEINGGGADNNHNFEGEGLYILTKETSTGWRFYGPIPEENGGVT